MNAKKMIKGIKKAGILAAFFSAALVYSHHYRPLSRGPEGAALCEVKIPALTPEGDLLVSDVTVYTHGAAVEQTVYIREAEGGLTFARRTVLVSPNGRLFQDNKEIKDDKDIAPLGTVIDMAAGACIETLKKEIDNQKKASRKNMVYRAPVAGDKCVAGS